LPTKKAASWAATSKTRTGSIHAPAAEKSLPITSVSFLPFRDIFSNIYFCRVDNLPVFVNYSRPSSTSPEKNYAVFLAFRDMFFDIYF
jgi:hypothetical protein